MSFNKKIAMIMAGILFSAAPAWADGKGNELLKSFSISGYTSGDVLGAGSPKTEFQAGKQAWNKTSFAVDAIGDACIDCKDILAVGSADVGEMAYLNSQGHSTKSDEVIGSAMNIDLLAGIDLDVGNQTVQDQTRVIVDGSMAGFGIGDTVVIDTNRTANAKVQQVMDYSGSLCGGIPCGSVTRGLWGTAHNEQSVNVVAEGSEAVTIANTTNSALQAQIDLFSGPVKKAKAPGS